MPHTPYSNAGKGGTMNGWQSEAPQMAWSLATYTALCPLTTPWLLMCGQVTSWLSYSEFFQLTQLHQAMSCRYTHSISCLYNVLILIDIRILPVYLHSNWSLFLPNRKDRKWLVEGAAYQVPSVYIAYALHGTKERAKGGCSGSCLYSQILRR
jgi:hypothetical protein